jgi:hypothetical protein
MHLLREILALCVAAVFPFKDTFEPDEQRYTSTLVEQSDGTYAPATPYQCPEDSPEYTGTTTDTTSDGDYVLIHRRGWHDAIVSGSLAVKAAIECTSRMITNTHLSPHYFNSYWAPSDADVYLGKRHYPEFIADADYGEDTTVDYHETDEITEKVVDLSGNFADYTWYTRDFERRTLDYSDVFYDEDVDPETYFRDNLTNAEFRNIQRLNHTTREFENIHDPANVLLNHLRLSIRYLRLAEFDNEVMRTNMILVEPRKAVWEPITNAYITNQWPNDDRAAVIAHFDISVCSVALRYDSEKGAWKLWMATGVYWHYLGGYFQYRNSFVGICDGCGKTRPQLPQVCCLKHAVSAYRGVLRMNKYNHRGFQLDARLRTPLQKLKMKPVAASMLVHMWTMLVLKCRLIRARNRLAEAALYCHDILDYDNVD